MKKLLIMIFLLTGCAQIQANNVAKKEREQIEQYLVESNEQLKAGNLKYSDYYKHLFDMYSTSHFTDKGYLMAMLTEHLDLAIDYEAGKINKEEFDLKRMKLKARMAQQQEIYEKENRAEQQDEYERNLRLQALKNIANPPAPIYQMPVDKTINTNCYSNNGYTNCTSR